MLYYPKVILFDLDDTLISFKGVAEQAWEKCCIDFINKHSFPYVLSIFSPAYNVELLELDLIDFTQAD